MPVEARGVVRKPPVAEVWTCPNCAVENVSILAHGCPACGAGRPGQKATAPATSPATEVEVAFEGWVKPIAHALGAAELELMRKAFQAGWAMATPKLPLVATPAEPLVGTPETRTIRAALQFFIDQVLVGEPEEVDTGEWLSADAARKLLATF